MNTKTIVTYLSETDLYSFLLSLTGQSHAVVAFIIFLVFILAIVGLMSLIGGLGTYAERKISADIQARYGPNRVGPYGILQFLADGIKMITKEDIIPRDADKKLFTLAPALCMIGVFASLVILPFSGNIILADFNVGLLYLLGVSSLVGVGIFLGGYAANSKWSMLGGMRAASQIISYEIPVTLSILTIVVLSGTLSLGEISAQQTGNPLTWYIFNNPFSFISFFIFFIGALAETNRAPFDLPEAESELVSGYHTEYSGIRFGFFALAEYIEVFVVCGVASALFLGGYNLIGMNTEGPLKEIVQVVVFFSKAFLLYYVVIWVRWTLPRLRVDQLMSLCWKYLTPIAMFNLIGAAVWTYFFAGKSLFVIIFS